MKPMWKRKEFWIAVAVGSVVGQLIAHLVLHLY
jgi:hypothetical protein